MSNIPFFGTFLDRASTLSLPRFKYFFSNIYRPNGAKECARRVKQRAKLTTHQALSMGWRE